MKPKRTVRRRVVSDKTAGIMRYALERVVACGTGRGGYVEGMRVMGKKQELVKL
ncbi:MAG: hypothetical protein L6U99_01370 [Clostridium sp.]|nr:MAG: hypothetical protein L6U99_01370 [Clostridium sp.]